MLIDEKPRFVPAVTIVLISFLAGALFVIGGYFAYKTYFLNMTKSLGASSYSAVPVSLSAADQSDKLPDIASIVKKVSPAVVNIETTSQSSGFEGGNSYHRDSYFRQFFGGEMPYDYQNQGVGSGFIINKEGYILTNEHVIDGVTEINVKVAGSEKPYKAKVIGSDSTLDLAVIKIDADKDLSYLQMGDSNKVNVGDWAIAIGSPYGLDHTVTAGLVSAKGRPVTIDSRQFKNLLQTDAAINPGNSGGPLLNLAGEVIGINTAVNAEGQGIGFAIPTSTIEDVLEELIEKGKVTRPYLGIYLQTTDTDIPQYYANEIIEGALLGGVVPGSPAEKAGLQAGDIILSVNGKSIKTAEELQEIIKQGKVGTKLTLKVLREGKQIAMTVVLGVNS